MAEQTRTMEAPQIADHSLVRRIGQGSYGEVWLAKSVLGTYRAVKIIARQNFSEDRPFDREFQGLQQYEPVSRTHPGLVAVLQVGRNEAARFFYYVMEVADDMISGQEIHPERYEARTLSSELARRGRLPVNECFDIALSLTAALGHLHQRGLIHRDIKPSNIIFVEGRPKFADVGLVTNIGKGSLVGSLGYIAPEGPGKPPADIFGLGKVLYQLFLGKSCDDYPELPTDLDEVRDVPLMLKLNELILKTCEPDQSKRFQTVEQLEEAVRSLQKLVHAEGEPTKPAAAGAGRAVPAPPVVEPDQKAAPSRRVILLYKSNVEADARVLELLQHELQKQGHQIFFDKHLTIGMVWAREIERQIREADAVIVLLSNASVQSEMLAYEVEIAWQAAQQQRGRPQLLPVRVQFSGPLPSTLAASLDPFERTATLGKATPMSGSWPRILDSLQYFLWRGPEDDAVLVQEVSRALALAPRPVPVQLAARIEPAGGAVPLASQFYVERPTDQEFQEAIMRRDSIVLLKGARQMGKTSLLARGIHGARGHGARVVLADFQKLNTAQLATIDTLFLTLGELIAEQLDLPVRPADVWDERRGANTNFERYWRREVLPKTPGAVVWAMDEVDRLFACSYGSEVFGLFRAWHNERALDPDGPWSRLSLAMAYATEAHLFITDINQSPFNVGTRIALSDFTADEVNELNRRHGTPLSSEAERGEFYRLLAGQPYLVRRGLNELVSGRVTFAQFAEGASRDEGIFGDHLRRILVLLAKDEGLTELVRGVLRGDTINNAGAFYRLRSAGVLKGEAPQLAQMRCALYGQYLQRHLL